MGGISDALRTDLRAQEFSEGYAESFLDTYVATQIRVLREQREMTQAQLAEKLGTKQTVVSRIESANYSAWNISTLKKLARAFNVRLHVSFETYGSLIGDFEKFGRTSLERAERDKDPILYPPVEHLREELLHVVEDMCANVAVKPLQQRTGRALYAVPAGPDLGGATSQEQLGLRFWADVKNQRGQVPGLVNYLKHDAGNDRIALTGAA